MSARDRFMNVDSLADVARIAPWVESQTASLAVIAAGPTSQGKHSAVRATPKRRLAVILSADVAGYSRLMQEDDVGTHETLKQHRGRIGEISAAHQGRVVNTPGDAILVEFSSAVEALAAAVEMQDAIEASNEQIQPEQRMAFRIGLDLGDILVEADGSVYGNGVNIAARMESLAHPGGIVLSGKVFDEVHTRLPQRFHALGQRRVKNIRDRVRAYEATRPVVCGQCAGRRRFPGRIARDLAMLASSLLLAAAGYFVSSPRSLDKIRVLRAEGTQAVSDQRCVQPLSAALPHTVALPALHSPPLHPPYWGLTT